MRGEIFPNFQKVFPVSSRLKIERSDNLALQQIAPLIHEVRGQRVILDADLAAIYGVPVKALNQAIKRNADRFPGDFVFRLTRSEFEDSLRSQFVTSKGRGGRRYPPYVFTEHGAIMAATVLNSTQAIHMSVFVVRAFVKLREVLATHNELAGKLTELEHKVGAHDKAILSIIVAIRGLTQPAKPKSPTIGFRAKPEAATDTKPKQLARRARKK